MGKIRVMVMRLAVAVLVCVLGALAGVYHSISSRHDAHKPSTYREQVSETRAGPRFAPLASPSRARSVARLPARSTAGSTSTEAFSRLAALSLGTFVDAVAIGDITGDGRDDVIASTYRTVNDRPTPNDFKVWVFVQQPDGGLASPLQLPFPGYTLDSENRSIALVDLNKDGFRDIVLGQGAGYGSGIFIVEGAATGQLAGRSVAAATESVSALVALDINRDGNADIATFDGFRIKVYSGDGRGALQHISTTSTSPVGVDNANSHMAAGDLNGDGRQDLAVFNGFNEAAVFTQTGSATFERWVHALNPYPQNYFSAMTVTDFDHDGDDDLMFATHVTNRNYPLAKHSLYRQSGGQLTAAVRWDAYDIGSAMIGADMDGDGREDLLTVRTPVSEMASIGYSRQLPDGSFGVEARFPLTRLIYSASPRGLAAGDFTGDGCSDIAVASGNDLVLLQGECPPRRVTGGLLPPRLSQSPTAMPGTAASARTIVPIDDATLTRTARRSARTIAEPARRTSAQSID